MGDSEQAKVGVCEGCGAPTTYVGLLPSCLEKPALTVFACSGCKMVAGKPVTEMA